MRAVGIDFGTTNSAVALFDGKTTRLADFGGGNKAFRSLLFFPIPDDGERPKAVLGSDAVAAYLDDSARRLLQSLKSFLASKTFRKTVIFGRTYSYAELLGFFLLALRERAERSLGPLGHRAVVGRPVVFAGDADGEALALSRLRNAFARAGFTEIVFEYEPIAAAYAYESSLEAQAQVLIADFGGGTSDFCLMRLRPGARGTNRKDDILGTSGAPLAGDAFDARIARNVVAPGLGQGGNYRGDDGKLMPIPNWIYSKLQRWHLLSFLKERKTIHQILEWKSRAVEPAQLEALLHLVRADLGYHLFRKVEGAKIELSASPDTELNFQDGPLDICGWFTRGDFEGWITPELNAISGAVDQLLEQTRIEPAGVDRVFMTGGTSFVPAARALFESRFGADRIVVGDRFTSVAHGLALKAGDVFG